MITKVSLLGLLLLQLAVPSAKAFVSPTYKEGGLAANNVATETSTSLTMAKKILCSFGKSLTCLWRRDRKTIFFRKNRRSSCKSKEMRISFDQRF